MDEQLPSRFRLLKQGLDLLCYVLFPVIGRQQNGDLFCFLIYSNLSFIKNASASSHSGSLAKPHASRDALLRREFFGRWALAPYSSVLTGCTVTFFPANRKTASASSAQEQKPSFVA